MSLKLAMRQTARRAPRLLGESAALVRRFVRSRQNPDGGFQDRAGRSDLYYTVFGLDAFDAFDETPDLATLEKFLRSFGDGDKLDFVHLTCLARCWSELPGKIPDATRKALLKKLRTYRAADGGFAPTPAAAHSTAYACLLAGEAFQALEVNPLELSKPWKILASVFPSLGNIKAKLFQTLEKFRSADGAYANEAGLPLSSTTATAAAVVLLVEIGAPVPAEIAPWLHARCHARGGFCATPQTPLPDLLSTAVALHALAMLGTPLGDIKEPCLNFIDSLWDNAGGFHGHWADDALDVEYTFYALLALGHLG